MEIKKPIPAPFTKGVNFTNWLEHRSADEIKADYFVRQDFVNARSLGCDVIRLPIHFEKLCSEADGFKIPDKILNFYLCLIQLQLEVGHIFHYLKHYMLYVLLHKFVYYFFSYDSYFLSLNVISHDYKLIFL